VVRDKEVLIRIGNLKHIIEAQQGKIYVESEFGVGSEFSFTLAKQTGISRKRLILSVIETAFDL
jgi:two-component system phosphate regulon sensor histidine kinase PhoR